MTRFIKQGMAGITLLLANAAAHAADDYPVRPIFLEVGFEAGGPTDVVARIMAKAMSANLKTSVIVENKPGASASIAANDVMRAAPDGYRLLVSTSVLTVNPLLYPDRYKYDTVKAFEPVGNFVTLPMVMVTNYDSPYKSVQDLVADAKAHPSKVSYGSSGVGSSAHLTGEMLATQAGITMIHVPYKGNGPALQETIAGRISFMFFPSVGIANYVNSKRLRVLALGSKDLRTTFPGVPTLDSIGYTGFEEGSTWVGLLAPANTPKPIVEKLNQAAITALNTPDVREQLASLGAVVQGDTSENFRRFLIEDKTRWSTVIQHSDLKP
ncbi:ABC transporter substrate-binding protein [Achromobacter sp. HZ28]|nr:ABC transporter substrate-binding protein [Achromobacter sp. HZ34]OWT73218.1 ABC transporter substrate-binding protein [Achromobacter sp. HZ28]